MYLFCKWNVLLLNDVKINYFESIVIIYELESRVLAAEIVLKQMFQFTIFISVSCLKF